MKKVMLVVWLFCTFTHLNAQPNGASWQGGLKNGLREGKWLKYDSKGNIHIEANYQNGKLHGRLTCWQDSVLRLEAFFNKGLRDSLWRYFYPNESLQLQAYFREGEPTNTWTEFFGNGKAAIEMTFSGGLKQGSFTHYFANGQANLEMQYLTDLEEGDWVWYDSLGNKVLTGLFWDGNPEDQWKSYRQGQTHWVLGFSNGKLEGEAVEYNPDGSVRQTRVYDKGNLINQSEISDPKGNPLPQGDFRDGFGEKFFYNLQNQLIAKAHYQDNRLHGTARLFDSTGYVIMELGFEQDTLQIAKLLEKQSVQVFRFRHGQLTGLYEYFEQENLILTGFYHNNQKTGLWTNYEKGIKKSEWQYENDQKNGSFTFFYPNGQSRLIGFYQHDQEEGIWQYFYADSVLQQEETWANGKLLEIGLVYAPDGALLNGGDLQNGSGERLIYDETGNLVAQGLYNEGVPEGNWIFYEKGTKYAEGEMKLGLKNGFWRFFYPNGKIQSEGIYENDKPVGVWRNYNKRGKLIK